MIFEKEASDIAKKTFNEYDKNKDGKLSKDELRPLLERVASLLNLPKATDKDIEEGMKKLDSNKNGRLEFSEFYQFFREVYHQLEDK